MSIVFGQDRIERIANEVVRRTKARKDYVAPRAKIGVTIDDATKALALTVSNGTDKVLPFKRPALLQLASSVDFPVRFIDRLQERGHTDLVAANLSTILEREAADSKGPRKHLIRELDGQVDGFLSDRFRVISNDAILAIVLEEAARVKAEVWDFKLTDTLFNIQLIRHDLRAKVEFKGNNAHEFAKIRGPDWQRAALTVGNSENGHGRFYGDISIWAEACRNFAIVQKGIARIHTGKRLEEGEQLILSDETKGLEDAALVSKLKDVVRAAFDPVKFKQLVDAVSATTARTIGDEVGAVEVVDATVKTYGLTQERKESILEQFLLLGKTQYALAQAVTAQVNPDNAESLEDGARVAFEQAGGSVLALGERDWKSFLRGAYKPKVEEETEEHQTVQRVR